MSAVDKPRGLSSFSLTLGGMGTELDGGGEALSGMPGT